MERVGCPYDLLSPSRKAETQENVSPLEGVDRNIGIIEVSHGWKKVMTLRAVILPRIIGLENDTNKL